jgi:hypothetical protein
MREITDFSKVIAATPKTYEESWKELPKMSMQEQIDFLSSDNQRYEGPEYLLEYENGKKTTAQLIGQNMRGRPLGPKNSKWFIPKKSQYLRFGPRNDETLKVYEPTAKKLMYEQLLRQKTGDPNLASVMKTKYMIHKGKGGKKYTRRYRKSSKKTRRHHRK